MRPVIQSAVFAAGLLMSTVRAVASPDVDLMSDIEVTEYAERMSNALNNVQYYQICEPQDTQCISAELARYGVSYDDKETVQKRLVILVGSVH